MTMSSNSNESRRSFLRIAGGASVVGASTMLAGCTGGDGGEGTTTAGGGQGEETTSTETTASADAIQTGGTLRVAMQSDFDTLHPHKIPGTTGSTMAENFGNALVQATPDGEVVPDLAREMPEVSNNAKQYTFKLRKGVTFHEPYDEELTADNVVRNWRRILSEDYGAYGRSTYTGILVADEIDPKDSVQKTGKYEVTFNLDKPFAPFLTKQAKMSAFGWFTIVPMKAVEEHGEDFGTADTGVWATGPFTYSSDQSRSGSKYVYTANENYFKEGQKGQLPYLDELVFEIAPESTTRTTGLKAGDIDIDESTAATDISGLKQTENVRVLSQPSSAKMNQWVNTRNFEPFTDATVRKALMHAANREAIVQTKFRGYAAIADSPLPPWHWAYDEEACVTYRQDVEKAKSLLQEAGYGDGFEFKCEPTNQPKFVDTAKILQRNYQKAGMEMSVKPASKGTTYDPLVGGWGDESVPPESFHSMVENFTWGFSADDYTYATFHTEQPFNYSYYSNEKADEAMEKARQTRDKAKRKEHYATAQKQITDDMPQPFLVWNNVTHSVRSRVHNFDLYPTAYMLFEDVWVESE
jgi:peptide/nickel transport system substrate-binding protein